MSLLPLCSGRPLLLGPFLWPHRMHCTITLKWQHIHTVTPVTAEKKYPLHLCLFAVTDRQTLKSWPRTLLASWPCWESYTERQPLELMIISFNEHFCLNKGNTHWTLRGLDQDMFLVSFKPILKPFTAPRAAPVDKRKSTVKPREECWCRVSTCWHIFGARHRLQINSR